MPKSKRNKQIELAKTKKRGLDWKKQLFAEVRTCIDSYANVFVFSVNDMRNSKMKNVREQWKHSRFFIGKNKIMAMALGRSVEEEYKPNLHKIGQEIKGQRGLLFSNKSTEEVLSWFRSYSEGDYARSGNSATEDVKLSAGPLPMFPHSLEPYLRQLGLPTSLVKGQIHLVKDHEVCKAGDILTPESAKILKLLGYEMAEFHFTIDCMWSHDGTFMKFTDTVDVDTKENVKKRKKKSKSIDKKPTEIVECTDEDMEVELDESRDELKENKDISEDENETKAPLTAVSNTPVANTGTPEAKSENVENNKEVFKNEEEIICLDDNESSASLKEDDVDTEEKVKKRKKKSKSIDKKLTETVECTDEDMVVELDENRDETKEDQNIIEDENEKAPLTEVSNTPVANTSTPKAKSESVVNSEVLENEEEIIYLDDNESSEALKEDKSSTTKSRPTPKSTRKSKALKRNSIPKTPDANTSQDSPLFRQLRNRSVKVNRKRK